MRKIFKKGIKVSAIIAALMCSAIYVTETAYSADHAIEQVVGEFGEKYFTETAKTPSEGTSNPAEKPTVCDHSYKYVITKQPTCTEKGELVRTCTKCGDRYTEEIKAIPTTLVWVLYAFIAVDAIGLLLYRVFR